LNELKFGDMKRSMFNLFIVFHNSMMGSIGHIINYFCVKIKSVFRPGFMFFNNYCELKMYCLWRTVIIIITSYTYKMV